jgi:hypothetical protein
VSAYLPERIPLDAPPGDPTSVDDLVRQVYGAAFCLGVLETSLRGPAGTAPGWRGDDATAAAARVAAVTTLARDGSGALSTAAGRLAAHRDVLVEARSRIAALVAQQDDDYAAAWARLGALPDVVAAMRTGAASAVAVVDEFAVTEAARRREHAAVLEDVAADARATARVLAACSTVVGGTGRPGDESRAIAHLALALPAWGAEELALRGAAMADDLGGLITPEEREALARAATAYADLPAFADALLAGLGEAGVRGLLTDVGGGALSWHSALAALLASALGAASPSGGPVDPVGDVLAAVHVDPHGATDEDVVALGMGAVIAAGLAGRSTGPGPQIVLAWGQQLVAREVAQWWHPHGGRAIDRANGVSDVLDPVDPLQLVAESLARSADGGHAAALLAERSTWDRLLTRPWDDGAVAFAALVDRAGAEDGPAGRAAAEAGLAALAAGLEDGEPDGWTVDRATAAVVSPALGRAVAAHVDVVVDALWVGVDDSRCFDTPAGLRGLALLTVDRGAAATVAAALHGWTRGQIADGGGSDPAALHAGVAVPSAYLAAQNHGQRLAHVLDTFEAQAAAQQRAREWDWTIGLIPEVLPGHVGTIAGVVEGVAAALLRMDGTWVDPVDGGLVFDAATAIEEALAVIPRERMSEAPEIVAQVHDAFDRTGAALGTPVPVSSPPRDLADPLEDAASDFAGRRRRRGEE